VNETSLNSGKRAWFSNQQSASLLTFFPDTRPEQPPIVHSMDIVEELDTGGEREGSTFEPTNAKASSRPPLTITLPSTTKVPKQKKSTLVSVKSRKKIKTQLPEFTSPVGEEERVAFTSNQGLNLPPVVNNDSVTLLPSSRRRKVPETVLAEERPAKRFKETAPSGTIEVQTGSCQGRKYQHTKRCTACIVRIISHHNGLDADLMSVEEGRRTL
jgi:hypothetical protein